MEWELIKEKYNKAYRLKPSLHGETRKLYDFFDDNGITVLITCEYDFGYDILDKNRADCIWDNIDDTKVNKWYSTRTEAEEQAFIKAFEILESRLSENNQHNRV